MAASLTSTGITFSDGTSTSTNLIPTGTLMLFQQTSAPTGWTKQTTHNDKALRVVSGTVSSGGSVAFTTVFATGLSAGATTLSTAQIPSHTHGIYAKGQWCQNGPDAPYPRTDYGFVGQSGAQGGGGSHTHSLNMDVQYVDLIIASKN